MLISENFIHLIVIGKKYILSSFQFIVIFSILISQITIFSSRYGLICFCSSSSMFNSIHHISKVFIDLFCFKFSRLVFSLSKITLFINNLSSIISQTLAEIFLHAVSLSIFALSSQLLEIETSLCNEFLFVIVIWLLISHIYI